MSNFDPRPFDQRPFLGQAEESAPSVLSLDVAMKRFLRHRHGVISALRQFDLRQEIGRIVDRDQFLGFHRLGHT